MLGSRGPSAIRLLSEEAAYCTNGVLKISEAAESEESWWSAYFKVGASLTQTSTSLPFPKEISSPSELSKPPLNRVGSE